MASLMIINLLQIVWLTEDAGWNVNERLRAVKSLSAAGGGGGGGGGEGGGGGVGRGGRRKGR